LAAADGMDVACLLAVNCRTFHRLASIYVSINNNTVESSTTFAIAAQLNPICRPLIRHNVSHIIITLPDDDLIGFSSPLMLMVEVSVGD